jgi:hypothetical protein
VGSPRLAADAALPENHVEGAASGLGGGISGGRTYLRWREVLRVQYWSSFEDLERFARSPEESHMPGWKRFSWRVRKRKCVGLWHEAYIVN